MYYNVCFLLIYVMGVKHRINVLVLFDLLFTFVKWFIYNEDMLCICSRRMMETSCKTYFMSGKIKE